MLAALGSRFLEGCTLPYSLPPAPQLPSPPPTCLPAHHPLPTGYLCSVAMEVSGGAQLAALALVDMLLQAGASPSARNLAVSGRDGGRGGHAMLSWQRCGGACMHYQRRYRM